VALAHLVVTSTDMACRTKSKKKRVLQHGIDTEKFQPGNFATLNLNKILFLGRISPVKGLEFLLEAFDILSCKHQDLVLDIVGQPGPSDGDYFKNIKKLIEQKKLGSRINFLGRAPNFKTPQIYRDHGIFVNLTASGSFDKATLEAMSCGLIIFVSNLAYKEILPPDLQDLLVFKEKNSQDLADKISKIFSLPPAELAAIKKRLRQIVINNHNLDRLIDKLAASFKELLNK